MCDLDNKPLTFYFLGITMSTVEDGFIFHGLPKQKLDLNNHNYNELYNDHSEHERSSNSDIEVTGEFINFPKLNKNNRVQEIDQQDYDRTVNFYKTRQHTHLSENKRKASLSEKVANLIKPKPKERSFKEIDRPCKFEKLNEKLEDLSERVLRLEFVTLTESSDSLGLSTSSSNQMSEPLQVKRSDVSFAAVVSSNNVVEKYSYENYRPISSPAITAVKKIIVLTDSMGKEFDFKFVLKTLSEISTHIKKLGLDIDEFLDDDYKMDRTLERVKLVQLSINCDLEQLITILQNYEDTEEERTKLIKTAYSLAMFLKSLVKLVNSCNK